MRLGNVGVEIGPMNTANVTSSHEAINASRYATTREIDRFGSSTSRTIIHQRAPREAAADHSSGSIDSTALMSTTIVKGNARQAWPNANTVGLPSACICRSIENSPVASTICGATRGNKKNARKDEATRPRRKCTTLTITAATVATVAANNAIRSDRNADSSQRPSPSTWRYQWSDQVAGGNSSV